MDIETNPIDSDASDLQSERFAAELHDGLIQWLVAAKMQAEAIRAHHRAGRAISDDALESLIDTLQRGVAEGRQLLDSLHVPDIDGGYWHTILQNDLARTGSIASEDSATPATIQYDLDSATQPLPKRTATTAYRLIREAVWNAQRHSAARTIRVSARVDRDQLQVEVADDGRGFDPHTIPGDRMGVRGMIDRATRAGGTADLQTAPGQGTRFRFELPMA